MGQEIVYCFKCLKRLTGADFDRGGATRLGNRASCTGCLPDLLASLTADEKRQFAQQLSRPKDTARRELAARPSSSAHSPVRSSSLRLPIPERPRSGVPVVVWAVVGAAAAGIVVLLLWPSTPAARPTPKAAPPAIVRTPPPPPPAAEDPRLKPAKEAVERARAAGTVEAWAAALRLSQGTPYEGEARTAVEKLQAAREADELDAQTRALIREGDFGGAQSHLAAVRKRHDRPDWHALVDQALATVRAQAQAALPALREKAVEARRRNAEAEVSALRERVARWDIPPLLEELDRAVAAVADEGWRSLFDGRTLSVLRGSSRPFWQVEDGALVKVPGAMDAAQTSVEFADAELRIRFEARGVENVWFAMRQGADCFRVEWAGTKSYAAVGDGEHELRVRCKGDKAEAWIDGRPVTVAVHGKPVSGCLQFNAIARVYRILSIEMRP